VHFDSEVHLGEMDKKVHLVAKMDRPYVGIRKNHMDQIKMEKKSISPRWTFLSIFKK